MGTVFRITVPDDTSPAAIDEAFGWLAWVEATFSTFTSDSEISRIARGEFGVDDACVEVRHVLAACAELEVATEGRFTIRNPSSSMIDPSGFVKGWSVDEAALLLIGQGVDGFIIDAGGDVVCIGSPPDGGPWRVAVRHPDQPDEALALVLEIPHGAVATSGTYYRGDHIWRRGQESVASVTVVGPRLGTADALATAIFADAGSIEWMSAFPEYGVVLVTEGVIRWTEGLDGAVIVPA